MSETVEQPLYQKKIPNLEFDTQQKTFLKIKIKTFSELKTEGIHHKEMLKNAFSQKENGTR